MNRAFHRLYRRYPVFLEALHQMNRTHNRAYEEIEQLEREGKIFVLRPDRPVTVKRLERDASKLEALYQDGRRVMLDQLDDMMLYLNS
jgi:predicted patatin/cPLA2 family phospholipase